MANVRSFTMKEYCMATVLEDCKQQIRAMESAYQQGEYFTPYNPPVDAGNEYYWEDVLTFHNVVQVKTTNNDFVVSQEEEFNLQQTMDNMPWLDNVVIVHTNTHNKEVEVLVLTNLQTVEQIVIWFDNNFTG